MTDGLSPPTPPRFPGATWLSGTLRAQRWMWEEAIGTWFRRPLPSARHALSLGEGRRFALGRGSWMSVLVPMVVFSQFVDVLVAQGVVQVAAFGNQRLALHGLLLLGSLWTVAWAVALRSATRRVDHVLGPHALTLAIGFKQRCRLPLTAIADVRRIEHKADTSGKDWHAAFGLQARDVTLLSPLDPPTLLIALKDDAVGACWTCNGAPKPLKRWVAVYVDKPDAMRATVAAAIAELRSSDAPRR